MEYSDVEQLKQLIESRTNDLLHQQKEGGGKFSGLKEPQEKNFPTDATIDPTMPLLFVQNTKNLGSLARYTDDEYLGEQKDSAPNYTVGQTNTFTRQMNRGAYKRSDSQSDEFRSNQDSQSSNQDDHDSQDSESLDSQTNILDLEADAEYDCDKRSRGDSFENMGGDLEAEPNSLTKSPELKKKEDKNLERKRKRVATMRAKNQVEKKTLTFVDMSHLSFLSKSVSQANPFKQQNH